MKESLRKSIFIASTLVFVISCGILIKLLLIDPTVSKRAIDEAKSLYYDGNLNDFLPSQSNRFDSLIDINNEIKGWLKIDNTVIDYPVVQSDDPEFYLNHNYKKESSRYGSIFIDSRCKDGANSKNIILHGHHMRDGQMFAGLMKFSDLEFYKSTPTITFDTPEQTSKWKIISVFKTNTRTDQGKVFNYLVTSFINSDEFLNYIYDIRLRSLIETDVNVNESDKILTLSTCSYEFEDFRTVIVARKVRTNETETVNVDNAKLTQNPLMPECWYKKYGGSPPTYSNFYSDYNSGKIKWYN